MKRRCLGALIFSMGLAVTLFGCGTIAKTPKPVIKYTINYNFSAATLGQKLPVVIKIAPFGSAPGYESTRMIYANGPFERNAYLYNRWFSPPAEMVAHAILKDLRASNAVAAVTLPGDRIRATHVLSGGVTDFYERDDHDQWYAVLGISILLFVESGVELEQEILLEKQYNTEVQCKTKNAAAFAAAMNTAVQSLSNQIIADIYHAVEENRQTAAEN